MRNTYFYTYGTTLARPEAFPFWLGENQTLIRVDGRRLSGVRAGVRPGQPNLNGIPFAAVERIEVLPTTASAIYGGSATGGVISSRRLARGEPESLALHHRSGG